MLMTISFTVHHELILISKTLSNKHNNMSAFVP